MSNLVMMLDVQAFPTMCLRHTPSCTDLKLNLNVTFKGIRQKLTTGWSIQSSRWVVQLVALTDYTNAHILACYVSPPCYFFFSYRWQILYHCGSKVTSPRAVKCGSSLLSWWKNLAIGVRYSPIVVQRAPGLRVTWIVRHSGQTPFLHTL